MKPDAQNTCAPWKNDMFQYQINPQSDVPIYRQLVDQISAQIHSGALKTGAQLPTVREMAERLHLSCGTIKHVYDTLQEMGDIEMTRRRGTFVKYIRRDTDSRKKQAMCAIDHMIRKLSDLNFSPAEIQIFLNLKMREWGLKWSGIRIAVVTDYPEASGALNRQLSQIGNVQVNMYPISQLSDYPYHLDEQNDVILASVRDAQRLSMLLPNADNVIRVAFHAALECVTEIASCSHKKVGVLCESEGFFELVRSYLPQGCTPCRVDDPTQAPETVIYAEGDGRIGSFSGHKIPLSYQLDEGSMLYLKERISKIRDERQQWPGALRT